MKGKRQTWFVEARCAFGGCRCGAWEDWFMASDDRDPTAIDEERDPKPLSRFPFDPKNCADPERCAMYRDAQGRSAA